MNKMKLEYDFFSIFMILWNIIMIAIKLLMLFYWYLMHSTLRLKTEVDKMKFKHQELTSSLQQRHTAELQSVTDQLIESESARRDMQV